MLDSTSIQKSPKVVNKAAFPEQESQDLAIEVGLMAPFLLSGKLHLKWEQNTELIMANQ